MCDSDGEDSTISRDGNPMIVASGGWSAPTDDLHELAGLTPLSPVEFPKVQIARGGPMFPKPPEPGTPEWRRAEADRKASEAMNAFITRHVGDRMKAQDAAMDGAIFTALFEGWEVHFQRSYESRFVGIAFRERGPGNLVTVHEDGWWWDNLEDYDDE